MNNIKKIRIGSGAGYAGDRIDPAVELAEKGNLNYLVFECLAERTIALANQMKIKDPNLGYDSLLERRMRAVLPFITDSNGKKRFKIISNMGAANPHAAIKKIREIAQELQIPDLKIAAVTGDDVIQLITKNISSLDNGLTTAQLNDKIVSANAYLGVEGIIKALNKQADIIITGRVADPSLFLAPLIYEFNWQLDDWDKMGKGTVIGHLLECAGQVTGGYFADPGVKDVPDLDKLGFPIAEVDMNGEAIITKVEGSGGLITEATCKEQLLYEIHNPSEYKTPDVVADFSKVSFEKIATNQIKVIGATGKIKPDTLKVTVGFKDGYIGEGQISYGGPNAKQRAILAQDIVLKRLKTSPYQFEELRTDLIGINSLYGNMSEIEPYEVRLRVVGRTENYNAAVEIGNEVEALYTNGPYGGGGATKSTKEVLAVAAMYINKNNLAVNVIME
nr:acyclic terpene utilization AtuA family protein [Moraxella sp. CTOTU48268]